MYVQTSDYSSGSQPFKTHGPLGNFYLGSRTTIENCSASALWLIY